MLEQQLTFPSIFDSSMLSTWKSCEVKFWRTYVQHWKARGQSVHLHAGGAFARGLEVSRRAFYEEGLAAESAIAAGLEALIRFYGDFQCPADSAKSLERTAGALEFYFSRYPLSHDETAPGAAVPILLPSGRRAIEFSFAHPLPIAHPETGDPLIYCGRMDAIVSFAGSSWICDEKTTTALGASWASQWDLRAQFTGYAWGCREAGIPVSGAIVRGVSILKTKYDTLAPITYRPEWQIQRWYDELLTRLEDIINAYKLGRWRHDLDSSCQEYGGCGLRNICTSENPEPWLETHFEKRVWNPLTREEKEI